MGLQSLLSPDYSDPPISAEPQQRVIVASADDPARELLAELCIREGYQALCVNAPEALLRQGDVYADMLLPYVSARNEDAFELCADLRTTPPFQHTPMLLVTAEQPTPDWTASALLSGADDVCSLEPQFRDELRARLRVQLRNKRYRDAIGRLRQERNDLRSRNNIDALTGVLRRDAFERVLETEFGTKSPFAVLFCDVDHFKRINDTYGHQTGDMVLKDVASALAAGCRAGDACGRYGGEEFVLLVRQVNPEQAERVAERHRAAVARLSYGAQSGPNAVTISIGVAPFAPDAPDPSIKMLLARADDALYAAKSQGRDRVVVAGTASESTPPDTLNQVPSLPAVYDR